MSCLVALSGRDTVPCAPYADFGSQALADAAVAAADGCDGVLLASHGLLCLGADLEAAFQLAVQLEFCAVLLTAGEMARARERFGSYGQPGREAQAR